jgi:tRNA pseudouridine38-40 synthase
MRYFMTVAYDGTRYQGWQVQPDAPSVQEAIEAAFETLCGGIRPRIQGSGRTDTGVHARGQVFHVDPAREGYAPGKWVEALNGLLPEDVRILEVREVADSLHARYDAVKKEYRYFVSDTEVLPPDLRQYRLHVRRRLDREAMQAAAEVLTGTHDFTAFSANRGVEEEDAVRTLETLTICEDEHGFYIRAVANGFLYKMVRRLTGALLRIGSGEIGRGELQSLLDGPRRDHLIPTVAPQGLFLWNVTYPDP